MNLGRMLSLVLFTSSTFSFLHSDQGQSDTQHLIYSDITPLAGPVVENWAEFFVSADFIYWKAEMEGLAYAQDGNYAFGGGALSDSVHSGDFKTFDFGFQPGFKAGVGVDFRHDGWYLGANYTWLQHVNVTSSAENHPASRGQLVGMIFTTLNPASPITPVVLDSAHAQWKLRFNVVDLELGRSFYISRYLVLKPYIGMKYGWIDQKYKVFFDVFSSTTTLNIIQSQDYWGIGLRGGLGTEWHFTRNWSIYGNLAVSELYGQFEETRKDTEGGSNPGVAYFVRNNFHTIKPVLEMAVGLRYETFFSRERYQLFFQAGWEEQIWFNQNQLIENGFRPPKGDLVFQGLDIKAGFSF
jgi:hypothetical protein